MSIDEQFAVCRSCGAAIIWATTLAGRPVPVNIVAADRTASTLIVVPAQRGFLACTESAVEDLDDTALFDLAREAAHIIQPPEVASVVKDLLRNATALLRPLALAIFSAQPQFVSHFATCPQADDWRKR